MDLRDMQRGVGNLVELAPERPVTLRLGAGSTVSVTAGTVWLTQEGMLEDVVLTAGQAFTVPERGMQVLSAVDRLARVRIADVHAQAHALRRAELRRLFARLRIFFRRGLRAAYR